MRKYGQKADVMKLQTANLLFELGPHRGVHDQDKEDIGMASSRNFSRPENHVEALFDSHVSRMQYQETILQTIGISEVFASAGQRQLKEIRFRPVGTQANLIVGDA